MPTCEFKNITYDTRHHISSDIFGPGILISYVTLILSTALVWCFPHRADSTSVVASLGVVYAYAITTIVAGKDPNGGSGINDYDISYSAAISGVMIAMSSVAMMSIDQRKATILILYVAASLISVIGNAAAAGQVDRTGSCITTPSITIATTLTALYSTYIVYQYYHQLRSLKWDDDESIDGSLARVAKSRKAAFVAFWIAIALASVIISVPTAVYGYIVVDMMTWTYGQVFAGVVGATGLLGTVVEIREKQMAVKVYQAVLDRQARHPEEHMMTERNSATNADSQFSRRFMYSGLVGNVP